MESNSQSRYWYYHITPIQHILRRLRSISPILLDLRIKTLTFVSAAKVRPQCPLAYRGSSSSGLVMRHHPAQPRCPARQTGAGRGWAVA
jgi:hypothetical protein